MTDSRTRRAKTKNRVELLSDSAPWEGREIDEFVFFIAVERGLSTAYQLSVRQTLDALMKWMKEGKRPLDDLGTDERTASPDA